MLLFTLKPLATVCASINFLRTFAFFAQVWLYSALLFQVHFVWPLKRFCGVSALVCGIEWGDASLPLRPSLPQIGVECEWGKKREKKHLSSFHSINHDSSFSSTSLVPIFIGTHLSPCHHICIQLPANYTARFLQTTLISNDVFSDCVGIRNINEG